jgi:rare lipoprotein A
MRAALPIALSALVMIAGCGPKKQKRQVAIPRPVGYTETGIASWYGHPYHGRAAANGEVYDMEKMTAAHRTLPFDTWVRVRNLSNRKQVEVRITDRGPFIDGRIIDLSRAAARDIDLLIPGVTKVRLEIIAAPTMVKGGQYGVQVGAFQEKGNAERLRREMERRFGPARLVAWHGMWRVVVGSEATLEAANALAERVRTDERARAAFVVRLDL